MTCDRYWDDGIDLVERGAPDPHRATCAGCQRAHAAYLELIELVPQVSGRVPDTVGWEARVWRTLARGDAPRRRWQLPLGGALAAACTLVLAWLLWPRPDPRPAVAVLDSGVAQRGSASPTSAALGDRIRVAASPGEEIRIYREDRLILRCLPRIETTHCKPDRDGTLAELALTVPGAYQVMTAGSPCPPPLGTLDHDAAAILRAGAVFELRNFTVR